MIDVWKIPAVLDFIMGDFDNNEGIDSTLRQRAQATVSVGQSLIEMLRAAKHLIVLSPADD